MSAEIIHKHTAVAMPLEKLCTLEHVMAKRQVFSETSSKFPQNQVNHKFKSKLHNRQL
jgi:hypothetical protein